jgi:acetyl esterase/lipase
VWIHGGGWTGGTKNEARAKEICTTLAEAGYVAASIDYKLGDAAWPTNLFDCKNAVRFLRARAAEYHVDPERIAVAGGSAGGHLALMVAFTAGQKDLEPEAPYPGISSAVRCVIDMYGPANLATRRVIDAKGNPGEPRPQPESALRVFGAKSEKDDALRLASPVMHVTPASPPVLILHGRADTTVDYLQSQELAGVLKQHGVAHELLLIDDVGHTFAWQMWGKKKMSRNLGPVALKFLAEHLR